MVYYLIYVCTLYRQYNSSLMSLQKRYFQESTTVQCSIYISVNYYYILCIKYYFYFLCNVKLFSFIFKLGLYKLILRILMYAVGLFDWFKARSNKYYLLIFL